MKDLLGRLFGGREREGSWRLEKEIAPEAKGRVNNPDCGWYRIYPFSLLQEPDYASLEYSLDESQNLVLLEFTLEHFAEVLIPEENIRVFCRVLDYFAGKGKRLILRPCYDLEGDALEKEPKSIQMILDHIRQLGAVIAEREAAVFMVQGLMIGSWGEMHGSRYVREKAVRALYDCMRESIGEQIWIALRRPVFVRWIIRRPDSAERVCLYNDAIFGSPTDLGTYGEDNGSGQPQTDGVLWTEPWPSEKELAFQQSLCASRPNGGEALLPEGGSGDGVKPEQVHRRLERMHLSFLNSQYDHRLLEQWRGQNGALRPGESCFDAVSRRLGYRYILRDAKLCVHSGKEDDLSLELTVENGGYAQYPGHISCLLTFDGEGADQGGRVESGTELSVMPGERGSCRFDLAMPSPEEKAPAAAYTLRAALQTQTGQRVCFANEGASAEPGIKIGRLVNHSVR